MIADLVIENSFASEMRPARSCFFLFGIVDPRRRFFVERFEVVRWRIVGSVIAAHSPVAFGRIGLGHKDPAIRFATSAELCGTATRSGHAVEDFLELGEEHAFDDAVFECDVDLVVGPSDEVIEEDLGLIVSDLDAEVTCEFIHPLCDQLPVRGA